MLKINTNCYDEDLYISYFKKHNDKKWRLNLDTDYSKAYKLIHKTYSTLLIPDNIKDFLLLKPEKLVNLYFDINKLGIMNDLENLFDHEYKYNGEIHHKGLFDYNSFTEGIADFFCNTSSNLNLSTCYYCNMTYINSYTVKQNNKNYKHFDVDHFIPQKKCSFFSLCLYNLVPSCPTCNERIKNEELIINNKKRNSLLNILPSYTYYNFHDEVCFKLIPHKFIDNKFSENIELFHIELCKTKNAKNYEDYKQEALFFRIPDRYNFHRKEFLNYIDKRRTYTPECISMMAKTLSTNNLYCSEHLLNEAIFNTEFRKNNERIFKLIYEDIDNIFNN